jgi:hypothetical protein
MTRRVFSFLGIAMMALLASGAPAWAVDTAEHGVREFLGAGSYTWTAPAGATAVLVELWGAGGGGTAADRRPLRIFQGGRGGYGGGSGAYVRTVVPVVAGQTYTVRVGQGGAGSTGPGNGQPGEATQLIDPSGAVLTYAGGGEGASSATRSPGAGGTPDPSASIKREGDDGGLPSGGAGGIGGTAISGSVQLPYSVDGGRGGSAAGAPSGRNGGPGYAILYW